MTKEIEIRIPDLGNVQSASVIEILVKSGDRVEVGGALITVETDKASIDVPSSTAGDVIAVTCQVGDQVSSHDVIAKITVQDSNESEKSPGDAKEAALEKPKDVVAQPVVVPDIGQSAPVDVIEVHVAVGDTVEAETPLITLESDKASMDIPAPHAGQVAVLSVKVGDKVGTGDVIAMLTGMPVAVSAPAVPIATSNQPKASAVVELPPTKEKMIEQAGNVVYAGPAVRRVAREFGVDLTQVVGSARKGRIVVEDVQKYVKSRLQTGAGKQVPSGPVPTLQSLAQYGDVEELALSKIKQLTAQHMSYCWQTIPQVTQFDEADITELEAFRQRKKDDVLKQFGVRLTPLVFIMKAVVHTLQQFPNFNASLSGTGQSLYVKKYYHIGVAVDTPKGLVVPVIRDVEQKSLVDLAQELTEISGRARKGGLGPKEMQGGTFTISSLGGLGGTAFTPIVNAPEVAILGVAKSAKKPSWDGDRLDWIPRLMLPLCLSYDHRVIDGAEAARFCRHLADNLTDMKNMLL